MSEFEEIGQGLTVYVDEPVEGPVRWLDSPQAVMDFVQGDDVADTIVLARGGTTTFLTPALTAGVKGVMTLQGAPESHLGILSREYGTPCIMGVAFDRGVRSARGEVIPADGARVRLDVSSAPQGKVLIEPGSATIEDWDGPTPPQMDPEQMAQIQVLLANFGGEVPHGVEGDSQLRASLDSDVLTLSDESLRRDLTTAEVNDLSRYAGWNTWDCLALRATEGESGLIPRQEYEAVAFVQCWQRYPEFFRRITEEIGVDGLIEIGRTPRREIGTKINPLHNWAVGFAVAFGRGVGIGLGITASEERASDLAEAFQFQRRLYRGTWDGLGEDMFGATRGYRMPLLEEGWLERFAEERTDFADPEQRKLFQRFSASTELMGFLQHFDNRSGLSDSGPYPIADGGFVIVRDHFLAEPLYQWRDACGEDLPYAITQAMFFKADEPLDVRLLDIGTLFTEPANYLKYLTGAAVYARDSWDTPIDQVRRLDDAEMREIQAACDRGTGRLYPHIAAMSKREKIMAGVKVYYADFILPYARAAGVWEALVEEHDFFELDPVASSAYYDLVSDGVALQLLPQLFLTGANYPPVPAEVEIEEAQQPCLHALALRGSLAEPPGDVEGAVAAELVLSTTAGYMLTDAGRAAHASWFVRDRAATDLDALATAYERFLAANKPFKALSARWGPADEDSRFELLGELEDLVERVGPALGRSAEVAPRFGGYRERLDAALARALDGDHDYVTSPTCESVHTVWMEAHEDFLQTQGISREDEGSY